MQAPKEKEPVINDQEKALEKAGAVADQDQNRGGESLKEEWR